MMLLQQELPCAFLYESNVKNSCPRQIPTLIYTNTCWTLAELLCATLTIQHTAPNILYQCLPKTWTLYSCAHLFITTVNSVITGTQRYLRNNGLTWKICFPIITFTAADNWFNPALKPNTYKANLTVSMKFFLLLKIWKNTNTKGYTLGPALAHFSVRWGQGPSAGGRKVLACPQLCRGNRHVREEEVEGALQSTGAIALSPQAACESRRRRLTCLFSSLILYSHMKELRSNLIEWERCQQKGRKSPSVLSQFTWLCRVSRII